MREVPRGNPPRLKRAKQVHHYRVLDGARFWHWSDQKTVPTPMGEPVEEGKGWVEELIEEEGRARAE